MDPITKAAAVKLGFRALTSPYNNSEKWMLENAVADLRRVGRKFALVKEADGISIWQK